MFFSFFIIFSLLACFDRTYFLFIICNFLLSFLPSSFHHHAFPIQLLSLLPLLHIQWTFQESGDRKRKTIFFSSVSSSSFLFLFPLSSLSASFLRISTLFMVPILISRWAQWSHDLRQTFLGIFFVFDVFDTLPTLIIFHNFHQWVFERSFFKESNFEPFSCLKDFSPFWDWFDDFTNSRSLMYYPAFRKCLFRTFFLDYSVSKIQQRQGIRTWSMNSSWSHFISISKCSDLFHS